MESPEQTELRRLDDTYDLLGELRREPSMVTWLGRHRALGRDVSVTVYRTGAGIEQDELVHLAADARLLTGARHESVVPVVESRWLSHDALAIVRARVRGSTLRRVLDEMGPLAADRTAEVLRQIGAALEWARRQGVVHRTLSSDTVCFQQGSGRMLLSFAATPAVEGDVASSWHHPPAEVSATRIASASEQEAVLLDRCSDTQTLGMLGWEMLTARRPTTAMLQRGDRGSLAVLRPDVPTPLARVVEDALVCERTGRDVDLPKVLARLSALAPAGAVAAAVTRPDVVEPVRVEAERQAASTGWTPPEQDAWRAATPVVTQTAEPAAVVERPRGRQIATAGIGLATLALVTWLFVTSGRGDQEREPQRTRTVATQQQRPVQAPTADTATVGGEVAFGGEELTTPGSASRGMPATPSAIPAAPGAAQRVPSAQPVPSAPAAAPRVPASSPRVGTPARATGATGLAACSSPAPSDQRACLDAHLALSDVELNRAYLQLIADLRARAGTEAGSEPPAVQQLRAEQRAWIIQRDEQCRRQLAGREGAIWAPARASCLGQISVRRANELWRRSEQVRQGG